MGIRIDTYKSHTWAANNNYVQKSAKNLLIISWNLKFEKLEQAKVTIFAPKWLNYEINFLFFTLDKSWSNCCPNPRNWASYIIYTLVRWSFIFKQFIQSSYCLFYANIRPESEDMQGKMLRNRDKKQNLHISEAGRSNIVVNGWNNPEIF